MKQRNYPKFLLSQVSTGKSQGIFIVHLLSPITLFKFEWKQIGYTIERIEWSEDYDIQVYEKIYKRVNDFAISNIADGSLVR